MPSCNREINTSSIWAEIVWAGIIGDKLIGSVLLDQRLTGEVYGGFLQN